MSELKAMLLMVAGLAALLRRKQWGRAAARQNERLWKMKQDEWWYILGYTMVGIVFVAAGFSALLGFIQIR